MHRLDIAIDVRRLLREMAAECISRVMITDEQLDRHGQPAQHVGKMGECFGLPPMSQVASYDHHFRVVVMGVDIRHRGAERNRRIQPVEPFAGRDEMGIG